MGSEIPSDLFDGTVYSLIDLPNNADCYIDELGIVWNARDSQSKENKRAVREMIILRHRGIKIISCCQQLSLVDINAVRFCTHKMIGYMENLSLPEWTLNLRLSGNENSSMANLSMATS